MFGKYYNVRDYINSLIIIKYIKLRYPFAKLGKNIWVIGRLHISLGENAKLQFGDNVIIKSRRRSSLIGINRPASINVLKNAELSIGSNSGFSGTSITVATKVVIGNYCLFGPNTAIWDSNFHPLDANDKRMHVVKNIKKAPITIGDDVFVGAYATILKGVNIGDRSIIGANSVVTKNVPPDEIWAGNPAKFVRKNK